MAEACDLRDAEGVLAGAEADGCLIMPEEDLTVPGVRADEGAVEFKRPELSRDSTHEGAANDEEPGGFEAAL